MAAPIEAAPGRAGARFFCTAGRGLEPFLLREVRARLAATQVEYISGKVFFSTRCGLNMLKKLKSAERLFLLIRKRLPLAGRRGRLFRGLQSLVREDPDSWVSAVSVWKQLLEVDAEESLSVSPVNPLKRKAGAADDVGAKKPRAEPEDDQDDGPAAVQVASPQGHHCGDPVTGTGAPGPPAPAAAQSSLTFRVSCRCSGAVGQVCTAQEAGRVLGITLKKQFGWKADLRNPGFEIFVHLNDVYSVVGIPVFRAPLASRTYIRMAGLRSTVAWALASLADIQAGAFVLDPMCGLGTVLLEAAKEWPDAFYVGADVSDAQLRGASDNLRAAGLADKVELLRVSVTELPWPSESVDAVVSDIPFGKKFKLGKEPGSILREMERVLRVGGTLVLLLSEDPHGHLRGWSRASAQLSPGAEPTVKHGPATNSVPRAEEPETEAVGVASGEGVVRAESPPLGAACGEAGAMAEPSPEGGDRAEPPLGGVAFGEGGARAEPPLGGVACREGGAKAGPPPEGVACGEDPGKVRPLMGSLIPVEQYRVSLGKTEALLCKYKKVPPEGSGRRVAMEEGVLARLQAPDPQAPLQT